MHGLGEGLGVGEPSSRMRLTISSANSGLPPERSATWRISSAWPLPASASPEERPDQLVRAVGPERVERDRGRVAAPAAPAGPAVEQLVAGQADQQHRPADPAGEVLDQVEHSLVGPVDVLDARGPGASGWLAPSTASARRRRSGRASPARPRSRARPTRATSAGTSIPSGRAISAASRSGGSSVTSSVTSASSPSPQLSPGELGVVGVDDLELAADHLAERPVGEAGAVGGAVPQSASSGSPGARATSAASSRSSRLLPTPAWPRTVTRCGRSSLTARSNSETSRLRLVVAADQRGRGSRDPGRRRDGHPDRLPGGDRLGLALQLERLELVVLDRARGQPVGDLADGDAAGPGRRLQARGDVDGVAHDRVVAAADLAREHLAGVDPDAQQEAERRRCRRCRR